ALSGSGVLLRALPPQRQSLTMANSSVAGNIKQALNISLYFRTQSTFNFNLFADNGSDRSKFLIIPFAHLLFVTDIRFVENILCSRTTNTKNIGKANFTPLISRKIYPGYTCHSGYLVL